MAGLQYAVPCPNVTGRTKERIAQSKRVRAGSLAIVDWPHVARTCILRAFGLQVSCCLSLMLVCFVEFCFAEFLYFCFHDAAALRSKVQKFNRSWICKKEARFIFTWSMVMQRQHLLLELP